MSRGFCGIGKQGRWKKRRAFSLCSLLRLFKIKTHRVGNYKTGAKKIAFYFDFRRYCSIVAGFN
jgi:hypothetical protein